MNAYQETYLDDAMETMGEMVDHAVNVCRADPDHFMSDFVASGLSAQFEKGCPAVVAGRSGIELVYETYHRICREFHETDRKHGLDYALSKEYWAGWSLAYYEWYSGRSFRDILEIVPLSELIRMYPALHESPEEKLLEIMDHRIKNAETVSRLQRQRKRAGLTQKALADAAGVNLRTLQQYEIRGKDLNQAASASVMALARVLGCAPQDILD